MLYSHPRCLPNLLAVFVAAALALAPKISAAQAPPAPPPTPDSSGSDDADSQPESAPTGGDDALPAPPTMEDLEGESTTQTSSSEDTADEDLSPSKIYDNQYLHIGRTQGDPIAHQFRHGNAMIAKRGTFGSIVDPKDFYEKVDRPDLAEKFQRRSTARVVVMGASTVVLSVGPYVFLTAGSATEPFCFTVCTPEQQRRQRTANTLYALAGVTFLGGLTTFVGTIFWNAHPVSVAERRELADEYNESLERDLGITESARSTREPPVRVRVGGAPTDGGAMGVLTLEF